MQPQPAHSKSCGAYAAMLLLSRSGVKDMPGPTVYSGLMVGEQLAALIKRYLPPIDQSTVQVQTFRKEVGGMHAFDTALYTLAMNPAAMLAISITHPEFGGHWLVIVACDNDKGLLRVFDPLDARIHIVKVDALCALFSDEMQETFITMPH